MLVYLVTSIAGEESSGYSACDAIDYGVPCFISSNRLSTPCQLIPENLLSHEELLRMYYCIVLSADGESLTSLSTEACQKALAMAGVEPSEVDLIILCTSTPEDVFGSAGQVSQNEGPDTCKRSYA